MSRIKVISQKNILKTDFFDVNEVDLELSTGSKRRHYDVIRRPAVSVFPITVTQEIYLVSQYRYMLERTTLEAVAGFIDGNEEPMDAAKRELSEELGLTAEVWKQISDVTMSASVIKQKQYLFLASGLHEGVAHPEEIEDITLIKMPLSEAVKKVMDGIIDTAATQIGILMLDKMRQEGKI